MILFDLAEIGFCRGTQKFSRLIEKLDGHFSHTYLKFTNSKSKLKLIYESHVKGGVQITPYEHFQDAIIDGRIEDVDEIKLDCDPDALWNECKKYHGNSYDIWQIALYYIWIKWYRRRNKRVLKLFNDNFFTCNEFNITACRPVVPLMACLDYSYTPNPLYKYMKEHSIQLS